MQDKRIIVTGGGSGIGRATVLKFAAAGAAVLAVDRDAEGLAGTAAGQSAVATLALDLTDADAPARIVETAREKLGGIDTLVNNAGIGGARPALETTDENWSAHITINLNSVFLISRAALPALLASGGSIVNTASIAGLIGLMDSAAYAAAKTGVVGLTRQMAADYGPRGVRINAVAPGLVESPMTQARITSDPRFEAINIDPIPMPRLGRPEDIANGIFFLASDEASYVNGHVLTIDGGWSVASYSRRGAAIPRATA